MFDIEPDMTNASDEQSLNREELLQLAIRTAKDNPQGARVMFQQVLGQDKRNERALVWMASLTKDKKERRQYLNRALRVNPRNTAALKELERMERMEKARSNRTLIYGGLVVIAAVLVIALVILFAVALA